MRLGFVCNEYPPGPHGGIGTMTRVLARALVASGHEVRVLGVYPEGYVAPDYEEDEGVRVWRLREPRGRLGWIAARFRVREVVAGWCRRGEVEIVEVPDYEGWAAGWGRLGVPVVVRLHGSTAYFAAELGRSLRPTTFFLERTSLRRANFLCSASEYTATKTVGLFRLNPGEPVRVLYNPVEEIGNGSGDRSRNQVVFTGKVTPKKGVVSLIKAWPDVLAACPTAELHLYGAGKDRQVPLMKEFLLSLIPQEFRGGISFHGHVDRATVWAALQTARLAVFPSFAEAFAIAPLESMSCSCPTIYSRRGSGPELIRDGIDGLLTDPDRPEEISAAIVRLLKDDDLARRLGEAGHTTVLNRFSVNKVLPQNESFYAECIARYG
jgi:glycosyltransferase involved in cell wall biosynthesis